LIPKDLRSYGWGKGISTAGRDDLATHLLFGGGVLAWEMELEADLVGAWAGLMMWIMMGCDMGNGNVVAQNGKRE
jgi:hypothetical protein